MKIRENSSLDRDRWDICSKYLEKHGSYGGSGYGAREIARFCAVQMRVICSIEERALRKIKGKVEELGLQNLK